MDERLSDMDDWEKSDAMAAAADARDRAIEAGDDPVDALAEYDETVAAINAGPDLITWLRAQLDEDERVALAASPGPWKPNAEHDEILAVDNITVAEGFALSGNQLRATVDHIARWDPARVLAEVEAKRAVLDQYEDYANDDDDDHDHAQFAADASLALEGVVKAIAQPYAGRPGWREERSA